MIKNGYKNARFCFVLIRRLNIGLYLTNLVVSKVCGHDLTAYMAQTKYVPDSQNIFKLFNNEIACKKQQDLVFQFSHLNAAVF